MKTKIYKISGVALALVLAFSLFAGFLPAKQTEAAGPGTTPNQWQGISIPSVATYNLVAAGANVTDFAVAGDGKTIYAVDNQAAAPGAIYSSPNNGGRWALLTNPLAAPRLPRLIAVAPDNPQAIAMVDDTPPAAGFAGGLVWISNNGGTTWAALNAVPGNAGATDVVTSIAIGPTRSGTILQRDYAVSVADNLPGAVGGGDVYFQGLTTAWNSCAAAGAFPINTFDFTSVVMSPGFLGDRCLVAVGSDIVGAGTAEVTVLTPGDAWLFIIKTSDVAPVASLVAPPGIVNLDTVAVDSPRDWDPLAGGNTIQASSIALPSDFDPTTTAGRRTWVGFASAGGPGVNGDDVYRIDNTTVRKLQTGAGNGIFSIAYSGTIAGGALVAGENAVTAVNTVLVWHTEDPQVAQPSWAATVKAPTGRTNCVVGIDLANPKLCYAGTTGVESAFSVSQNGGISFNQKSLIDTTISQIQDVMLSPDGTWVFMSTACAVGSNVESLWKSKTPTAGSSWERIAISLNGANWGNALGDAIVRLSPEFLSDNTLYWCDRGAPLIVNNVLRSVDGGDIFRSSSAPAAIADVTVENKDILYMASAANVYTSTNGAWFFGLPVATGGPGVVYTLAMAPTYPQKPKAGNLLAGFTAAGGVFLSTDGNVSWRPLSAFIAGGTNMQVLADVDYATNNTVYAASATAGQGIWRYVINTSTVWEQILLPGAPSSNFPAGGIMTGLAMQSGVLYGSWATVVAAVGAVAADQFTVTDLVGGDTGNLTVQAGTVRVTPLATATVGGIGFPNTVTIPAGIGAVVWATPAAGDSFTVDALTANAAGSWNSTVLVPSATAAITADADADAAVALGPIVAPAVGLWTLPDAAVAGVAGAVGSGAERSLIPDVPVIANWIFETMDSGSAAANFNAPPNALRVAATATSVNLLCVNGAVANQVFAYDDSMALAKPEVTVPETVPFDSVSGRNQQFTVSWKIISNATSYEVEIYTDPACTQIVWSNPAARVAPWYTPPQPLSPTVVVPFNTLNAGQDYFLRLRVRNQIPNDLIRSNYSSVYRFAVKGGERVEVSYLGVQPLGPTAGATGVPLSPGFTWSPYASATRYEFQLAKDPGFATVIASAKVATTAYKYDGKLDYKTTYFWRARGIEPTITDWSPVASFTTEAAPPPPPAPTPAPPPPPPPVVTPTIIWSIIGVGAILVIAVIVLIVRTRARA